MHPHRAFTAPNLMPRGGSSFCQIWSSGSARFFIFQGFAGGRTLARRSACREGSRKSVKEEFMKSLSELADVYEKWATANEATAEEILSRLDSLPGEAQQ